MYSFDCRSNILMFRCCAGQATSTEGSRYGGQHAGRSYKVNDIVGCLLDLKARTMEFSVNGRRLGTAFEQLPEDICSGKKALFPCISVSAGEKVEMIVGESELKHRPEGYTAVGTSARLQLLQLCDAHVRVDGVDRARLQGDVSVEAFVCLNLSQTAEVNAAHEHTIIVCGSNSDPTLLVSVLDDGRVKVRHGCTRCMVTSQSIIGDGDWTHIAIVCTAGESTVFRNGVLVETLTQLNDEATAVLSSHAAAEPLFIGGSPRGGSHVACSRNLCGYIAELRLWSVARTVTQLQQSQKCFGLQAKHIIGSTLIGQWRFCAGSGSRVYDSPLVSSPHHGTIHANQLSAGYRWASVDDMSRGDFGTTNTANVPSLSQNIDAETTHTISDLDVATSPVFAWGVEPELDETSLEDAAIEDAANEDVAIEDSEVEEPRHAESAAIDPRQSEFDMTAMVNGANYAEMDEMALLELAIAASLADNDNAAQSAKPANSPESASASASPTHDDVGSEDLDSDEQEARDLELALAKSMQAPEVDDIPVNGAPLTADGATPNADSSLAPVEADRVQGFAAMSAVWSAIRPAVDAFVAAFAETASPYVRSVATFPFHQDAENVSAAFRLLVSMLQFVLDGLQQETLPSTNERVSGVCMLLRLVQAFSRYCGPDGANLECGQDGEQFVILVTLLCDLEDWARRSVAQCSELDCFDQLTQLRILPDLAAETLTMDMKIFLPSSVKDQFQVISQLISSPATECATLNTAVRNFMSVFDNNANELVNVGTPLQSHAPIIVPLRNVLWGLKATTNDSSTTDDTDNAISPRKEFLESIPLWLKSMAPHLTRDAAKCEAHGSRVEHAGLLQAPPMRIWTMLFQLLLNVRCTTEVSAKCPQRKNVHRPMPLHCFNNAHCTECRASTVVDSVEIAIRHTFKQHNTTVSEAPSAGSQKPLSWKQQFESPVFWRHTGRHQFTVPLHPVCSFPVFVFAQDIEQESISTVWRVDEQRIQCWQGACMMWEHHIDSPLSCEGVVCLHVDSGANTLTMCMMNDQSMAATGRLAADKVHELSDCLPTQTMVGVVVSASAPPKHGEVSGYFSSIDVLGARCCHSCPRLNVGNLEPLRLGIICECIEVLISTFRSVWATTKRRDSFPFLLAFAEAVVRPCAAMLSLHANRWLPLDIRQLLVRSFGIPAMNLIQEQCAALRDPTDTVNPRFVAFQSCRNLLSDIVATIDELHRVPPTVYELELLPHLPLEAPFSAALQSLVWTTERHDTAMQLFSLGRTGHGLARASLDNEPHEASLKAEFTSVESLSETVESTLAQQSNRKLEGSQRYWVSTLLHDDSYFGDVQQQCTKSVLEHLKMPQEAPDRERRRKPFNFDNFDFGLPEAYLQHLLRQGSDTIRNIAALFVSHSSADDFPADTSTVPAKLVSIFRLTFDTVLENLCTVSGVKYCSALLFAVANFNGLAGAESASQTPKPQPSSRASGDHTPVHPKHVPAPPPLPDTLGFGPKNGHAFMLECFQILSTCANILLECSCLESSEQPSEKCGNCDEFCSRPVCPRGDPLVAFVTSSSSFNCDVCGKRQKPDVPMLSCRACDYDACLHCALAGAALSPSTDDQQSLARAPDQASDSVGNDAVLRTVLNTTFEHSFIKHATTFQLRVAALQAVRRYLFAKSLRTTSIGNALMFAAANINTSFQSAMERGAANEASLRALRSALVAVRNVQNCNTMGSEDASSWLCAIFSDVLALLQSDLVRKCNPQDMLQSNNSPRSRRLLTLVTQTLFCGECIVQELQLDTHHALVEQFVSAIHWVAVRIVDAITSANTVLSVLDARTLILCKRMTWATGSCVLAASRHGGTVGARIVNNGLSSLLEISAKLSSGCRHGDNLTPVEPMPALGVSWPRAIAVCLEDSQFAPVPATQAVTECLFQQTQFLLHASLAISEVSESCGDGPRKLCCFSVSTAGCSWLPIRVRCSALRSASLLLDRTPPDAFDSHCTFSIGLGLQMKRMCCDLSDLEHVPLPTLSSLGLGGWLLRLVAMPDLFPGCHSWYRTLSSIALHSMQMVLANPNSQWRTVFATALGQTIETFSSQRLPTAINNSMWRNTWAELVNSTWTIVDDDSKVRLVVDENAEFMLWGDHTKISVDEHGSVFFLRDGTWRLKAEETADQEVFTWTHDTSGATQRWQRDSASPATAVSSVYALCSATCRAACAVLGGFWEHPQEGQVWLAKDQVVRIHRSPRSDKVEIEGLMPASNTSTKYTALTQVPVEIPRRQLRPLFNATDMQVALAMAGPVVSSPLIDALKRTLNALEAWGLREELAQCAFVESVEELPMRISPIVANSSKSQRCDLCDAYVGGLCYACDATDAFRCLRCGFRGATLVVLSSKSGEWSPQHSANKALLAVMTLVPTLTKTISQVYRQLSDTSARVNFARKSKLVALMCDVVRIFRPRSLSRWLVASMMNINKSSWRYLEHIFSHVVATHTVLSNSQVPSPATSKDTTDETDRNRTDGAAIADIEDLVQALNSVAALTELGDTEGFFPLEEIFQIQGTRLSASSLAGNPSSSNPQRVAAWAAAQTAARHTTPPSLATTTVLPFRNIDKPLLQVSEALTHLPAGSFAVATAHTAALVAVGMAQDLIVDIMFCDVDLTHERTSATSVAPVPSSMFVSICEQMCSVAPAPSDDAPSVVPYSCFVILSALGRHAYTTKSEIAALDLSITHAWQQFVNNCFIGKYNAPAQSNFNASIAFDQITRFVGVELMQSTIADPSSVTSRSIASRNISRCCVSRQASLTYAMSRWLSKSILAGLLHARKTLEEGVPDAYEQLVKQILLVWTAALKSPLGAVVGVACDLLAWFVDALLGTSGDELPAHRATTTTLLQCVADNSPLLLLKRALSSLLDVEIEDSPIHSACLKSVAQFLAVMQVVQPVTTNHSLSDVPHVSTSRACMLFTEPSSSNDQRGRTNAQRFRCLNIQGRDIVGAFTAEFWLRKSRQSESGGHDSSTPRLEVLAMSAKYAFVLVHAAPSRPAPSRPTSGTPESESSSIQATLMQFLFHSQDKAYTFPPGQTSEERLRIHECAKELGLVSSSSGEGKDRVLTVERRKKSKYACADTRPYFAIFVVSEKRIVPFVTSTADSIPESERCPPLCKRGHAMVKSDFAEGAYQNGWSCDRCSTNGRGHRWWCKACTSDFCFKCSAKMPRLMRKELVVERNSHNDAGFSVLKRNLCVTKINPNCIAFQNGLRVHHRIIAVNGKPVTNFDEYSVLALGVKRFMITTLGQSVAMETVDGPRVYSPMEDWFHVAVRSRGGNDIQIMLNGQVEGHASVASFAWPMTCVGLQPSHASGPVALWAHQKASTGGWSAVHPDDATHYEFNTRAFCGQIGEIRYWNVRRHDSAIGQDLRCDIACTASYPPPGLFAHWVFCSDDCTFVKDCTDRYPHCSVVGAQFQVAKLPFFEVVSDNTIVEEGSFISFTGRWVQYSQLALLKFTAHTNVVVIHLHEDAFTPGQESAISGRIEWPQWCIVAGFTAKVSRPTGEHTNADSDGTLFQCKVDQIVHGSDTEHQWILGACFTLTLQIDGGGLPTARSTRQLHLAVGTWHAPEPVVDPPTHTSIPQLSFQTRTGYSSLRFDDDQITVTAQDNIGYPETAIVDVFRPQLSFPFVASIASDSAASMEARGRLYVERDECGNVLLDGYYLTQRSSDAWWEPNDISGRTADFPPMQIVSNSEGAFKSLFLCTHTPHKWDKISRLTGEFPIASEPADEAGQLSFPTRIEVAGSNADNLVREWSLQFSPEPELHARPRCSPIKRGSVFFEVKVVDCSSPSMCVGVCGMDAADTVRKALEVTTATAPMKTVTAATTKLGHFFGQTAQDLRSKLPSLSPGSPAFKGCWCITASGQLWCAGQLCGQLATDPMISRDEDRSFSNWRSGDVVGIELDMDAGTFSTYLNGHAQGCTMFGLRPVTNPQTIGADFCRENTLRYSDKTASSNPCPAAFQANASADGVVPFITLAGSGDSARLLGKKTGISQVVFHEFDPSGRVAFVGKYVNGMRSGFGFEFSVARHRCRWQFVLGQWHSNNISGVGCVVTLPRNAGVLIDDDHMPYAWGDFTSVMQIFKDGVAQRTASDSEVAEWSWFDEAAQHAIAIVVNRILEGQPLHVAYDEKLWFTAGAVDPTLELHSSVRKLFHQRRHLLCLHHDIDTVNDQAYLRISQRPDSPSDGVDPLVYVGRYQGAQSCQMSVAKRAPRILDDGWRIQFVVDNNPSPPSIATGSCVFHHGIHEWCVHIQRTGHSRAPLVSYIAKQTTARCKMEGRVRIGVIADGQSLEDIQFWGIDNSGSFITPSTDLSEGSAASIRNIVVRRDDAGNAGFSVFQNTLTATDVSAECSAFEAGIREGCKILAVNGHCISSFDEYRALAYGQKEFTLAVQFEQRAATTLSFYDGDIVRCRLDMGARQISFRVERHRNVFVSPWSHYSLDGLSGGVRPAMSFAAVMMPEPYADHAASSWAEMSWQFAGEYPEMLRHVFRNVVSRPLGLAHDGLGCGWDFSRSGSAIVLSDSNAFLNIDEGRSCKRQIVKGFACDGHGTAVVAESLRCLPGQRIKKWSFCINTGKNVSIGLVRADVATQACAYVGNAVGSWGYLQHSGSSLHENKEESYAEGFHAGDRVDVVVDTVEKTLRFVKNSVDQGVAAKDLALDDVDWFAAVSLVDAGDSVTLLYSQRDCASEDDAAADAGDSDRSSQDHQSPWAECKFGETSFVLSRYSGTARWCQPLSLLRLKSVKNAILSKPIIRCERFAYNFWKSPLRIGEEESSDVNSSQIEKAWPDSQSSSSNNDDVDTIHAFTCIAKLRDHDNAGKPQYIVSVAGSGLHCLHWQPSQRALPSDYFLPDILHQAPKHRHESGAASNIVEGPSGILFLCDTSRHVIEYFDPTTNEVHILAGVAGVAGSRDGNGQSATFSSPCSICWVPREISGAVGINDESQIIGVLFVCDRDNNIIRGVAVAMTSKSSLIATVFTAFGSRKCAAGFKDGSVVGALFASPSGLVFSRSHGGSLYVCDQGNHCIRTIVGVGRLVRRLRGHRQIPWQQQVGKFLFDSAAGSGPTAEQPSGSHTTSAVVGPLFEVVASEESGTDGAEMLSLEIASLKELHVATVAGTPTVAGSCDGSGLCSRFNLPSHISQVPSSGALLVADSGNGSVRMVDTQHFCVVTLPLPTERESQTPSTSKSTGSSSNGGARMFRHGVFQSASPASSKPSWSASASANAAKGNRFQNPAFTCIDEEKGVVFIIDDISSGQSVRKKSPLALGNTSPTPSRRATLLYCLLFDEKTLRERMKQIREIEKKKIEAQKRAAAEAAELEKARQVAKEAERRENAQNLAAFGIADLETCMELLVIFRDNMQVAADAMLDPHRMSQVMARVEQNRQQRQATESAEKMRATAAAAAAAKDEATAAAAAAVAGSKERSNSHEAATTSESANASDQVHGTWRYIIPRRMASVHSVPSTAATRVGSIGFGEIVVATEVKTLGSETWLRIGPMQWTLATRDSALLDSSQIFEQFELSTSAQPKRPEGHAHPALHDLARHKTPLKLELAKRRAEHEIMLDAMRLPSSADRSDERVVPNIAVMNVHLAGKDPSKCKLAPEFFGDFAVSMNHQFVLDPTSVAGSALVVSDGLQAVTASAKNRQALIFGNRGFRRGRHYWEVRISHAEPAKVFIGVSERLVAQPSHGWGRDSRRSGCDLVGFVNYRYIVSSRGEHLYGKFFNPGDIVGVLLDMDYGTVSFTKQGHTDISRTRHVFENYGVGPVGSHLRSGRSTRSVRFGSPPSKSRNRNTRSSNIQHCRENKTLFPVFGLAQHHDSVTIRFCNHWSKIQMPVKADTTWAMAGFRGSRQEAEFTAQHALDGLASLYSLNLSRRHSPDSPGQHPWHGSLLERAFALFRRMSNPNLRVVRTVTNDAAVIEGGNAGTILFHVHSTVARAKPLAFVAVGDEFSTARGVARILGIGHPHHHRFQLWFQIVSAQDPQLEPSERLSWYWTRSLFVTMLERGQISPVKAKALQSHTSHAAQAPSSRPQKGARSPHSLSFEEFRKLALTPGSAGSGNVLRRWSLHEDVALVQLVNSVADNAGCDPAHLTLDQLSDGFTNTFTDSSESMDDAARATLEAVQSKAGVTSANLLMQVRSVLLIELGAQLELSLPLVKFDTSPSTLAHFLERGAEGPMRQACRQQRRIIPLRNKVAIFNRLLQVSTTPTIPGEDDWEPPRDMKELTLDRRLTTYASRLQPNAENGSSKSFSSMFTVKRSSTSHIPSMYENSLLVQLMKRLGGRRANSILLSSAAGIGDNVRLDEVPFDDIAPAPIKNSLPPPAALSFSGKQDDTWATLVVNGCSATDSALWRRSYVHILNGGQERAFFVKFQGEGVTDQGGPYRAVLNKIVAEEASLSDVLNVARSFAADNADEQGGGASSLSTQLEQEVSTQALFALCSNSDQPDAPNRDSLWFNSRVADSTPTLALYNFLGKVVGLCMRHQVPIALPVAIQFWRYLSQDRMSLADVAALDLAAARAIAVAYMLGKPQPTNPALLETAATLSNIDLTDMDDDDIEELVDDVSCALQRLLPSTSPFKDNGLGHHVDSSAQLLSRANLVSAAQEAQWHFLYGQHRLKAASFEFGLGCSIPIRVLPIFAASEIQSLFCGAEKLDVELLERVAVYDKSCSRADAHIEFFWSALRDDHCFSEHERSQFLMFCWARSRLPTSMDAFTMPFKITAPTGAAAAEPDQHLPTSQTCFFTLTLPKYSSRAILVKKLKYAIKHTKSMDADFRVSNDEE